ncbi:Phosphoribosylanthranilate isomerase [Dehalogenimonas lykanthroporepellens BL-DC-9]|nr:Phosphoribosylanthranilate isomerase [Dehalogenimonas lykanthroporepellens BL-DC-9]
MTHIKICGVTDVETAALCGRLGADFIGLVFAESRRRVTPEKAMEITHHLLSQARRPRLVGVFVNEPAEEVNRIAEYCRLDRVQLSGDEDDDYCARIERPVIRAMRVGADTSVQEVVAGIIRAPAHRIHLLDARADDRYGGTGRVFDWQLLAGFGSELSLMVAGGLTPENVGELIRRYRPWGVDVSSGVEKNGYKDPASIRDFIREARQAEAVLRGVTDATG